LWILIEFSKGGRVIAEVLLERRYSLAVSGMVRQKRGELIWISVLELLKQPDQPLWVIARRCANVGSCYIRI
jgi:hypothetical protein